MNLPLQQFSEVVSTLRGPIEHVAAAEKRRAARLTVSAKLNIYLMQGDEVKRTYSALTRDISLTGMGLLQTIALPQGAEIVIALPRPHGLLFVAAEVLHCRSLADGILAVGIEFTRMIDEETSRRLLKSGTDERTRLRDSILN